MKFYKLSEVSVRDGKKSKDVWVVIKDSVYDVSSFVENHPGSSEMILDHAGKDCTKEFQDVGHSSEACKELKSMKIGELIDVR